MSYSTESSAIRSLTSNLPDGSTLVLNWQPPDSPNGDILSYTVKITRHSDGVRTIEQNVMSTTFTTTSLSELCINSVISAVMDEIILGEGVLYNVSVTPVNLAGLGSIRRVTLFSRELSKKYYF